MHKVLIATMSLGIGGAETHIIELVLELKRRGIDVSVASNGGVYVADLEDAGVPHFHVPMDRRNLRSMTKSYFMLRRIIKRVRPDIVHTHARIPGFICGLLHKKNRFKFVSTAHRVFDEGGGVRHLTNWGQKTIAVSDDIKQSLVQNYNVLPEDIYVTINGVDTVKFTPDNSPDIVIEEFGLDAARPIICNVSRLDEHAAAATRALIEAAPDLHKRLPGVQLLIVGAGTLYDELKSKADAANSLTGTNTVTMAGARTDVNLVLAACDLFVGVSRAALEAMAMEKPVIAAGNEGYAGLFTPEKTQTAVNTNFCFRGCAETNADLLLSDIANFFESTNSSERAALGEYGRELVLKNYSVRRMTEDCLRAYDEAVRRQYSVIMSGYYGHKNSGDEAILQSICRNIMTDSGGDVSITVLSHDPEDTKALYGYGAIKRFRVFSVLRALKRCDVLVSGGGSLLQDFTSTRSLLYYLFIINAAKRMGKKVMIYANGIGPVNKKANRRRVCRVVNRADVITLRDEESAEELRAMGVMRDDIRVTADPVFTMSGISREEALDTLKCRGVEVGPFIAVSIRNWPGTGDFCEKMASLCDRLYEMSGCDIVFIPMQPDKETGINQRIRGMMRNPSHVLEGRLTAEELMGIIGASDLIIAMRLHALIFAARMNVPFAGIVYDPKVSSFTKTLAMPSIGDVRSFDSEMAFEAIKELLNRRDEHVEKLRKKSDQFHKSAKEDPKLLMALLKEN